MNALMNPETPQEGARRLAAKAMRDGYQPQGLHEYQAADGTPIFWRIRLKRADGEKWIRPMHQEGNRFVIGEPAFQHGKVLYKLPAIATHKSGAVFVVEGESCVDAVLRLGIVATTSGSSASADDADWTPLRGRSVTVWPDHDEPGTRYAEAVVRRLLALGCDVRLVDPNIIDALPKGGDVVDWLAQQPDATSHSILALPTVAAPPPRSGCSVSGQDGHFGKITPLPAPLPPVPAFDARLLPVCVRAWCIDAADGLQVPLDFTAIPAMTALAGAIGRSVGIRMKRNDHWIERATLWACVIGRPSSGKSPALRPAYRMLERLTDLEHEAFEGALREYKAAVIVADGARANAKKAVQAALKNGDLRKASEAAAEAAFEEQAPAEPRLIVNDATVEKLGELLNQNPRGLVQYRDELAGWLASLDREGRESDRGFWLECWNGTGSYTVDRIGRGTIRIAACAVSILGGMQPGKLEDYVRGAVRGGLADDGLMQRFQLAVYPDVGPGWRYVDRAPDANAESVVFETLRRLRKLDPANIGADAAPWSDVPFLGFDDGAQARLVAWMEAHMQRLRRGEEPPWMESHLAKFPALVGRLALVLHLADGYTGPIAQETLTTALDWCDYLEGHARRVYAPATCGEIAAAHLMVKMRGELADGFTARDVYRRGRAGLTAPEIVQDALDMLVEHGYLIELQRATGGRPTIEYTWRAP